MFRRDLPLGVVLLLALGLVLATAAQGLGAEPARSDAPAALLEDARELPELRTPTSRTYAQPDGTRVAELAPTRINYRDAVGDLRPIDNRLVPVAGSGDLLRNAAGDYVAQLPRTHGAAPVRLEHEGRWVSVDLEGGRAVRASVSGNQARYAGVAPGVEVRYTATGAGLKEELVLAGAEATSRFSYRVALSPGLTPHTLPSGAIEFRDAAGAAHLGFARPYLRDSSESPLKRLLVDVTVDLERMGEGYRVTYSADREWLQAPERVFPVVLDPTVVTDGFLDSAGGVDRDCLIIGPPHASTNFCGLSELVVAKADGPAWRSLVRFDLTGTGVLGTVIPRDAQVHYGLLGLYSSGAGASGAVDVHALTQDWTTGATWDSAAIGVPWQTPGGTFAPTPTGVGGLYDPASTINYWDLDPATLQGWVAAPSANLGLLLKLANEATPGALGYYSGQDPGGRHPHLYVSYTPPIGAFPTDTILSEPLSDRSSVGVNVGGGNLLYSATDLSIAGTGLDLSIERSYNSRAPGGSDSLGPGWTLNHGPDVALPMTARGDAVFFGPSGYAARFARQADGSYLAPPGINATLLATTAGTGTLTFNRTAEVYEFTNGRLEARRDRNANEITYTYASVAGTQVLSGITDTQGRTLTLTHTAAGLLESITDSSGRQVSYAYQNGRLQSATDADGKTTSYAYTNGELTKITDTRGNDFDIAYVTEGDARRASTSTREGPSSPQTTFVHASASRTTLLRDPEGNETTFVYDVGRRVTSVTDPRGEVQEGAYNPNGELSLATDALGAETAYSYSADGRFNLTGVALPTGSASALTYGAANPFLPLTRENAQGNTLAFGYDSLGNRLSVTNGLPAGENQSTLTYNADGTIATATDANGNLTSYGYDALGNLIAIANPGALGDESFVYDGLSRLTQITDGKGQVTELSYDPIDRVTAIEHDDGSRIEYAYDANGNRTSRIEPAGTTTYTYDKLNRLTEEDHPGPPPSTYTYDRADNLTSVRDAGGTTGYAYNAINRVETITMPAGQRIGFGYDENGRRASTSYPNGVTETQTHDASGRLAQIAGAKGLTPLTSFTYSYQGQSAGSDIDLRSSVTDLAGNTTAYSYDVLDRLTQAVTTGPNARTAAYAYDANSNRLSEAVDAGTPTPYSYGDANLLAQRGATTFTHDANGNQTGSSAGFDADYNPRNQSTQITRAGGGTPTSFAYRGPGQVERTQTTGSTFINDQLGVAGRSDGAVATWWVRDDRGVVVAQRRTGDIHYYLRDSLGSIVALTDGAGQIDNAYRYDPFGNELQTASNPIDNPWRFAGEYLDTQTNLYKIGFRYYDQQLGRWTQQDPIVGFVDPRTSNRYIYAGQDPVNIVDPTGTFIFITRPAPRFAGLRRFYGNWRQKPWNQWRSQCPEYFCNPEDDPGRIL